MTRSKLLRVTVERFKSFDAKTEIELAPLTVILGRNNSGKSSLIQSLLLLKQTLAEPRPEVPLHLDGAVAAFNLRELTSGWPAAGPRVEGPSFGLRWACNVDVDAALDEAKSPDIENLIKWTELERLRDVVEKKGCCRLVTEIRFATRYKRHATPSRPFARGHAGDSFPRRLRGASDRGRGQYDVLRRAFGRRAAQVGATDPGWLSVLSRTAQDGDPRWSAGGPGARGPLVTAGCDGGL